MFEQDPVVTKSRRQTGQKSRTGCRTCKIRHVKCDEQHPSCLRCSSTGRACEYPPQVPVHNASLSLLSVGLTKSRSEEDMRGLDYFKYNASLALVGFDHRSEFWTCMVPRLSETSPAVLSAVLALSALHERTSNRDTDEKSAVRLAKRNVVFLRQYNKSIRQLCTKHAAALNRVPIQFTLTCCVLFVCLENLRGGFEMALKHLESGLKLLRDWQAGEFGDIGNNGDNGREMEVLTVVLRRLDMQATVFLNSRPPEMVTTTSIGQAGESNSRESTLLEFRGLAEAQLALEGIEIRSFYVETITKSSALYPTRRKLMAGLKARFTEWKDAFDVFSKQASEDMGRGDLQLSLLLAMHYQTTSLMLEVNERRDTHVTIEETMAFCESRNPQFLQIVQLCKTLLVSSSESAQPAFAADTGIIAPLYFVSMNAGAVSIREQAISILREIRFKEGFWSAKTAADIADRVLRTQMDRIPGAVRNGGIPELAEALSVVTFDD